MSSVDQLDLLEGDDEEFDVEAFWAQKKEEAKERKRQRRREAGKPSYRKVSIPCKDGLPFVIAPQVAPHLRRLAEVAGKEAGVEEQGEHEIQGIYILAARTAIVLSKAQKREVDPDSVARRLRAVINKTQLFVNATLVEACLMAMDAEHEVPYGEWPATRAAALERVSIEAEVKGKKVSPSKLLARANRLYEKGVRKAYRRACEVSP